MRQQRLKSLGRLRDSSDRHWYQAWFRFSETACLAPKHPIKPRRNIPISFNVILALAGRGKAPADSSGVWMWPSRALLFQVSHSSTCLPLCLPGTALPPQALLAWDKQWASFLEELLTPGKMQLAQPMEEEERAPVQVECFAHVQS